MTAFCDKFEQSLSNWSKLSNLPNSGAQTASILVALSGGADSVALLLGLLLFQEKFQYRLQAAHFNHELRREASDEDEAWVREFCNSKRIKCHFGKASEVEANAKICSEESARSMRYEFLTQTAQANHCSVILFAHHKDDQVETILHHILRGTGLRGLRGIPKNRSLAENVELYRPMLAIRKTEILEFLSEQDQEYRIDSSNATLDFTRNKLRNELLPFLRSEFNPSVDDAIVNLSYRAADAEEIIHLMVSRLMEQCVVGKENQICKIALKPMHQQPSSLINEFFLQLWIDQQWPRKQMSESEWSSLAKMVFDEKMQPFDLPGGLHVARRQNLLVITQKKKNGQ